MVFLIQGCGKPEINHWSEFVPESTLIVFVTEPNTSLDEMLGTSFMPMLDDMTPSAIQLISSIQEEDTQALAVDALLLYPDTSTDWQPVWVTQTPEGLLSRLTSRYQRDYEQNNYEFQGYTIEKLFFEDRTLFAIELGRWTVFSESSFALENMLRTLAGEAEPVHLGSEQITPGTLVFNIERLDVWVQQVSQVSIRPFLSGIFRGGEPLPLRFHESNGENRDWQMRGEMVLQPDLSRLLTLFSRPPEPFTLDRFIPLNAAMFAMFRSGPEQTALENQEFTSDIDLFLESDDTILDELRGGLGSEVAFVSFAESGPSSDSEYMYLREVNDSSRVLAVLDRLESEGLAMKDGQTYLITSKKLGKLFGSEINPVDDFHVTIYDRVAALSQRKGLAESIGGDDERRRVMYYDEEYSKIRNSLESPLSSMVYLDAVRFNTYVQPWLYPQTYIGTISSNFDQLVISTRLQPDDTTLEVQLSHFEREQTERPYREQWLFPLSGTEITGIPASANITGNDSNEIIFSTTDGRVYLLAPDGTAINQFPTGEDEPVGPPVIYDWYGNNQNIIMQAAGNKVYAWNQNGDLLPNFPVVLNEAITTPLTVMDVTGNGVAEMMLATANRQMHILNARGQPLGGWPQNTNAVVRDKPLVAPWNGRQTLFVFAENTLHAWQVNGEPRNGFPVFLTSQMEGSPVTMNSHILGAGLDGNVYAIGTGPLFTGTLATTHSSSESIFVQSLPVSNSSLNTTPSVHDEMFRGEEGLERDDVILLQSANGSVFLYNREGEIRFTQSLGQPASSGFPPMIADINGDERRDIIALADFGRLYAWEILSSDRHLDLPTSGMRYPLITDFYGDGHTEIIAQTREGIVCWTVFFTRKESQAE